jgi:hypothetical protein
MGSAFLTSRTERKPEKADQNSSKTQNPRERKKSGGQGRVEFQRSEQKGTRRVEKWKKELDALRKSEPIEAQHFFHLALLTSCMLGGFISRLVCMYVGACI